MPGTKKAMTSFSGAARTVPGTKNAKTSFSGVVSTVPWTVCAMTSSSDGAHWGVGDQKVKEPALLLIKGNNETREHHYIQPLVFGLGSPPWRHVA